MKIFISVAGPDRPKAEEVAAQLRADDHQVFLDEDALAAGQGFNRRIRDGIARADLVVFFVSAHSLEPERYTLTELKIIQDKWPNPSGRVLPVLIGPVSSRAIPAYLGAIKMCKPTGNIGGTVAYEISRMASALDAQKIDRGNMGSSPSGAYSFMLRPELTSSTGKIVGAAALAVLAALVGVWTNDLSQSKAFARLDRNILAAFNGIVLALLIWLAAIWFHVRSLNAFVALGAGAIATCFFEYFVIWNDWIVVNKRSTDPSPLVLLGCLKALVLAGFAGTVIPQFRDITRWGALAGAGALSGLFWNAKVLELPLRSFAWEALVVVTLAVLLGQHNNSMAGGSSGSKKLVANTRTDRS